MFPMKVQNEHREGSASESVAEFNSLQLWSSGKLLNPSKLPFPCAECGHSHSYHLLSTYYVPDSVLTLSLLQFINLLTTLSLLPILTHLILTTPLGGKFYEYPHFTDGEPEP